MANTTRPAAPDELTAEASLSRGRLAMIMVGVMLGMLFAALGQTIVGTALPRIVAELGGLQHYAWVFTGYMLTSTVTVPIYGKLSDIYGRRPLFLLGMALFLLGSGLCGLSQDMTQLIVFRAIQGLGAGGMMVLVQAIIGDVFPPAERGKWQGLVIAVFGVASIVGPVAGGWITDNWGWRWVFYVNMPVGILAILTAGLALPGRSRGSRHHMDYLGAALLVAAATPLLLAFSWGGSEYPWASTQIVGLLGLALAMGIGFVVAERRSAEPIISPSLFRNRVFSISVVATFLSAGGMYGAIIFLPLFIQGAVGESATNAGAVLTPLMLGFVVSAIVSGQIMSRTGRYKALAIAGFAGGAAGMFLLSRMDATATSTLVIRNMVVTGLGIGVGMSLFTIVVQNALPSDSLGQVTASLQFFRSIGGTIGVALLGTVMTNRFQEGLAAALPQDLTQALPPGAAGLIANPQALLSPATTAALQERFMALGPQGQALFDQFLGAMRSSLAGAITSVFAVGCALMVLGLVATLFLPEIPLRKGRRRSPGETDPSEVALGPASDVVEAGGARRR